jgi:hypothetical protein
MYLRSQAAKPRVAPVMSKPQRTHSEPTANLQMVEVPRRCARWNTSKTSLDKRIRRIPTDPTDPCMNYRLRWVKWVRTTQRHWFLEIYWAVAANECKRDSKSPYWYCSRTCLRYDLEKTQAPVKRSLNADVCSWSKANTWWTWATEASLGSWKTGFYRLGGGLSGLEKQTCHGWWEPCGF